MLAGEEVPLIPTRVIVRGGASVNEGYSWHIDPETLEFAGFTTKVCDGLPSDVEQEILASDRCFPWAAEVIAID
jgi:hypothetical protein